MEFSGAWPLPKDPLLSTYATVVNRAGQLAEITDVNGYVVWLSDEFLRWLGEPALVYKQDGSEHEFGPNTFEKVISPLMFPDDLQGFWDSCGEACSYLLYDLGGDRELMKSLLHPSLAGFVDGLDPRVPPRIYVAAMKTSSAGSFTGMTTISERVQNDQGISLGTVRTWFPLTKMSQVLSALGPVDPRHLNRVNAVEEPGRRSAAILMADLESSTSLSRRLSTAQYFALIRRLIRAFDAGIIDEGGIVGRHVGDGVVAFFLADLAGSESAAARSCIASARTLRRVLKDVASRSELEGEDLTLRFGLHWGSTLYVGRISTGGRSEVTALGDPVNETARIESCASGSRAFASKELIERLSPSDAESLDINPDHTSYILLADLSTASEKARRDAPAIAVCEV